MDLKVPISAFPPAVNIYESDVFPIVQSGVNKKLPFSVIRGIIGNGDILPGTFSNSDLVNGVLTITHNMATDLVHVFIKNPSGYTVNIPYKNTDANHTIADFGGAIDAGAWSYNLVYWNGGSVTQQGVMHKKLDIGPWNLSTANILVPHGLDSSKIMTAQASIIFDTQNETFDIFSDIVGNSQCKISWDVSNIKLLVSNNSWMVNNCQSLAINRGYILIHHNP